MENAIKETMLTYVEESPQAIIDNVDNCTNLIKPLLEEFKKHQYLTIWIIASGSSYNGANCAKYFLKDVSHMDVKIITPFTFINSDNNFSENDFIFVVSQSGYSTNAIDALDIITKKGRKGIALTGNINSDIKDSAQLVIDYGVGIEKVGYVTKGVTTLALFLMLFGLEIADERKLLQKDTIANYKKEMKELAKVHITVQKQAHDFYKNHMKALTSMQNTYVCGIGAGYGIALEGALKIGETVQVPSMPLEVEEYLHGPCLQINPNLNVFIVDNNVASKRVQQIYEATRLVSDRAYLITTDKAYQNDKNALVIDTNANYNLLPLCMLPFFQIISYQITEDTHKWTKHPLYNKMRSAAMCKTANYVDTDIPTE